MAAKGIKIGWAQASITPKEPVMLSGQFYVRISRGVMDPVTATVLALESGTEQGLLISCDVVNVGKNVLDMTRKKVASALPDLEVSRIIMNAIHTHSAPVMGENQYPPQKPPVMTPTAYVEFMTDQITKAAVKAWKARRPAGVSRAFGHAVVGHNRRAWYRDGHAEMYGKTNREDFYGMEGCEDHSVDMLFTWDGKKNLTGMIINLACPSQVSEHSTEITADYWHEVRVALRKKYGKKLFVLPQCSAAGDQSPHFLLYGREEEEMRKLRGTSEREEIGYKIAQAVQYAFPVAKKTIRAGLPFRHVVKEIQLTPRKITEKELENAQKYCAEFKQKTAEQQKHEEGKFKRQERVLERYKGQDGQKRVRMELHVLRIGETAMATNPFELYLDYGLRMKARSKAAQTFIVQLAGAGEVGGYLPTERAVQAGSYGAEPFSNQVGPEGGQELVEETLGVIGALWKND